MNSRIFFLNILARISLMILTSLLFIWLIQSSGTEILFTLIAGISLVSLQVLLLTRYVTRLSRIIELFMDSVGREEIPEIRYRSERKLFKRLMEKSNAIKEGMKTRRLEKQKDEQILLHAMNSADMGLLCSTSGGQLLFMNESAKGLVKGKNISRLEEIRSVHEKLWEALNQLTPGTPRVFSLVPGNESGKGSSREQLFSIRLKEVLILDETYSLFSIQNIQEELHKKESDSWQKIIRILTHEIMNAVAPMLSLAKSMQSRLKTGEIRETEKIADGLKTIELTGEGLISFIEEYRRLALLPPPKIKPFSFIDAMRNITNLLEQEIRDLGIRLTVDKPEPDTVVHADPQQFELVLMNLIRNSMESFEGQPQEKKILIRTVNEKNRVLIMVEDNGCGIPEELVDQVFVPFYSNKEQGSGIGLSLSRQIMHNHNGSIHLESVAGKKTIITLTFLKPKSR